MPQDVSAEFRDLDDTDPNILEKLDSLRVTYVIAGDILYIPYASIVCEKACGNTNSTSLCDVLHDECNTASPMSAHEEVSWVTCLCLFHFRHRHESFHYQLHYQTFNPETL